MSSPSFPAHDDHAENSQHAAKPATGLTFVLPPLSALKTQKSKKKLKLTYEEPVKKQPRPIKLKPLKEVLSKLIVQIKKKDDYAFFLKPVDISQVPGYNDVVSKPMDLGTMTTKAVRGKYRSLEEFTSDLKLVTGNAKLFNPPGSIYYTEAERIEKYALDHIAKASATVIEYETNWNIDVERDDELVAIDDDNTAAEKFSGTLMDVDDSRAVSPSVASVQVGGGRRAKGKKIPGTLSESLEADGGLPGAKDGLGAFPPGSDWAELMLALKLKGKRYRTKKERMRIEKGGPPLAVDGSLDYPEMEDPFSVLSAMVPDPPSRPYITSLYDTPQLPDPARPPLPAPTTVLPLQDASEPSTSSSQKSLRNIKPAKRRHWVLNRNAPTRLRAKDVEDEYIPPWITPRESVATDFGTFAMLPGVLVEEQKVRDVVADLGTEDRLYDAIRESLLSAATATTNAASSDAAKETDADTYWQGKAAEAEAYIRDVVYGGADCLAYVRSVAEFLTPSEPVLPRGEPRTFDELGMPVARWVEENVIDPLTGGRHRVLREASHILNTLPPTPPQSPPSSSSALPSSMPLSTSSDSIRNQVDRSVHIYPTAFRALAALQSIHAEKIDLPALIHTPDELFHAEDVWAGRAYREKRKKEMDDALARDPEKNAAAYLQWAIAEHREAETGGVAGVVEDGNMLAYALDFSADEIARLASRRLKDPGSDERGSGDIAQAKVESARGDAPDVDGDIVMKMEEEEEAADGEGPAPTAPAAHGASDEAKSGEEAEDPVLRKLRLNLLALAKRAPLDQIMKLPLDLVPAHLRHIVPTLDA